MMTTLLIVILIILVILYIQMCITKIIKAKYCGIDLTKRNRTYNIINKIFIQGHLFNRRNY